MMLGKPIIVARHTGMDRVVEEHALGKVIEYGNAASLEKALIDIAAMSDNDKDQLAQRAKIVYEQHYSWAMMRSRLVTLYDTI